MPEREDKPELRKEIADTLGALAEGMIKRAAPFDRIPLYAQLNAWNYLKCYQYYDELPKGLGASVMAAEIGIAKQYILRALRSSKDSRPIFVSHPEYKEAHKKLLDWVITKEGRPLVLPLRKMDKFNAVECIRDVIGKRLPAFEYAKTYALGGALAFTMEINPKHKMILYVDKGAMPFSLDFMLGLDRPRFAISVSEFYAGAQADFRFFTKEELIDTLNIACDFLGKFIPFFKEYVLKALSKEA